MERRERVKVKSGMEYDALFPKARLVTFSKKKGATVSDTITLIPQVVKETLFHTEKIAKLLKRKTLRETCRAVWQFVYEHIAYQKDEEGKEQVRSPARTWHDRRNTQGVDCDCYTVFISSILSNLKIKHALRITKYQEDHFQHIYPIVPTGNGSYITIDCVVSRFDYEEPYTEKKDTNMDLEYLNGVMDRDRRNTDQMDVDGIYDDREAIAELGRIFKRSTASKEGVQREKSGGFKHVFKRGAIKEAYQKGGIKAIAKIGLHVTNRLNPATILIRNGILIALKINMFKIAQRLRYAYLSEEEAKKRGIDMTKFDRLKKVKDKLQNIFYGAGGIPENFKKAMLTGRGNRDKQVSGLGYVADDMSRWRKNSTTEELLGREIFQDEELHLLSGLGEPYSAAASVTAATTILTAIAGLLKSIGNIFPKKDKASEDFQEGEAENSAAEIPTEVIEAAGESVLQEEVLENEKAVVLKKSALVKKEAGADLFDESAQDFSESGAAATDEQQPEGFWEKNKKWIKPVGIGITTLGLLYGGYRVMTKDKKEPKSPLSGIPKSKKTKKRKGGKKSTTKNKKKKESVTLL